jgi:hypothetical protein
MSGQVPEAAGIGGVTFERWITPLDVAADLLRADLRTAWN